MNVTTKVVMPTMKMKYLGSVTGSPDNSPNRDAVLAACNMNKGMPIIRIRMPVIMDKSKVMRKMNPIWRTPIM